MGKVNKMVKTKEKDIKTLMDLKDALVGIPDGVLKEFGVGYCEEPYMQLLVWVGEENGEALWKKTVKKYPQLNTVGAWVENISRASIAGAKDEDYDAYFDHPISSRDKFKD
jgi:hypothetical protein